MAYVPALQRHDVGDDGDAQMMEAAYFIAWGVFLAFMVGMLAGSAIRDRAWREKANGPSRMLSKGRFYQVLTSEAYDQLLRDYR